MKIVSFNIWDLPYWFVKNRKQRILQISNRESWLGRVSITQSLYSELAPLLGEYDAVIGTHFMQTYALLKAKHSLGLPTKIIAYVPDFDPSFIHVPCYAGRCVDAVLAQGPLLLSKLVQVYDFAPERMQRGGFLPRTPFTDVRALSAAQARERIAALDIPLVSHLRTDAFTVIVTGGTYWTMGRPC